MYIFVENKFAEFIIYFMLTQLDNKLNLFNLSVSLFLKVGILTHTKLSHVDVTILNVRFISTT